MPGFMPGIDVFMLRIEDVDGRDKPGYDEAMPRITDTISIDDSELSESFVRASGPGGQNVNKVSSAVQLRFDVRNSPSLPNDVAVRLMRLAGKRLTKEGVIVIIAQAHRTQERNRAAARERLFDLIRQAAVKPKPRRPTKVPKAQKRQRLEGKKHRAEIKRHRSGKGWD
jgi:ribosome-associated protein